MTDMTDRIAAPVAVEIKNWPDPSAKLPFVKNSTFKTYIVDPAGVPSARNVQICTYEPRRVRMTVDVIDVAVTLTQDIPTISPDASTASAAPASGGLYLPPTTTKAPYEFRGPEAMWVNSTTAVTRVCVVKEYQ